MRRIIDPEEMALNQLPLPTLINDLPMDTEEDRNAIRNRAVTTYDQSDILQAVPSCLCGFTKLAANIGKTCTRCGNPVEHFSSRKIVSDLWFKVPEVLDSPVLLPDVFTMISSPVSTKTWDGLVWMMKPGTPVPDRNKMAQKVVNNFNKLGIERSVKSFYENFDLIIEKVIYPSTNKNYQVRLKELIDSKQKLFTTMIPIPSKIMFVVEVTAVRHYHNVMGACLEAIYTGANLSAVTNIKKVNNSTVTVIKQMADFYYDLAGTFFGSKPGFTRQTIYGYRTPMSFRNIIVSEKGVHRYDEIKIPYKHLLNIMKTPVTKQLIAKHGMSWREATTYIRKNARKKESKIMEILETFIRESPNGRGIGCFLVRNPSLLRGSYQYLYITGITDTEIRISPLNLSRFNADFDGDLMNGAIILDPRVDKVASLLAPHYDVFCTSNPLTVNNSTSYQKPSVQITANWINAEPEPINDGTWDEWDEAA